jgi:predicted flap endonuclease-1-like 5' DNA nuclease
MLAVIAFLYFTICLRPPALLLAVGLLAFNVAGMAAVGAEIGGRLSERFSGTWTPTSRTALGVVVPGAIIVFLWAIGGCFGFFGNMGALLLGSFGVGAILVKALNLGAKVPAATPPTPETVPTSPRAPVATGAPADAASPAATDAPVVDAPAAVRGSDAAASDSAAAAPDAPVQTAEQTEPQAEKWWVSASELAAGDTPAAAQSGEPLGEMAPGAPSASAAGAPADFTRIEGIGPKLNQRLHAANIHTFADLVALPPETLAGILGWTSERLLRTGVIAQAQALAQQP